MVVEKWSLSEGHYPNQLYVVMSAIRHVVKISDTNPLLWGEDSSCSIEPMRTVSSGWLPTKQSQLPQGVQHALFFLKWEGLCSTGKYKQKKWHYQPHWGPPPVMQHKFLSSVMFLGVVSNEDYVSLNTFPHKALESMPPCIETMDMVGSRKQLIRGIMCTSKTTPSHTASKIFVIMIPITFDLLTLLI